MRLIPALLFATLLVQTAFGEAPRPNILLIVSDDQGYADAGFQGLRDIVTPHLDRLAATRIRFTNGYVTHAFCSPSHGARPARRDEPRVCVQGIDWAESREVNSPVYSQPSPVFAWVESPARSCHYYRFSAPATQVKLRNQRASHS